VAVLIDSSVLIAEERCGADNVRDFGRVPGLTVETWPPV
jgi:predicted nucleic acid-binding protein